MPDGEPTSTRWTGLVVPFAVQLVALSTALVLPLWLMVATRWPQSMDFVFQALALDQFSTQVWAGEWYPRWLTDVNAGLGSPVFLFHSPGAYWLGSALEWLAPHDPHGSGRLILLMQIALVASGLSARHWLRGHWSEFEAWVGALAYAGSPYLVLRIYAFGVSELWAIACLPLLLIATEQARFAGLALGYAVLALVHLPSCVVFGAVPVAYAAWRGGRRAAWHAVGAGVTGCCLAAFYLVPAVLNRPFLAERQADYRQNFSHPDAILAAIVTLAPILWLAVRLSRQQRARLWAGAGIRFWAAEVVAACVLMTPLSARLWAAVPLLQLVQFPFRFFTAILPGVLWVERGLQVLRPWPLLRPVVTAAVYLVAVFGAGCPAFVRDPGPVRRLFEQRVVPAPEYQTRWMAESNLAPWELTPEIVRSPGAALASGHGRIEVERADGRRIVLRTEIHTPEAQVRVKTAYFPGWTAANPVAPVDGLVGVVVYQGQERVELSRPYFSGEREGLAISLVTLGALLVFVALERMNPPTSTSPGPL